MSETAGSYDLGGDFFKVETDGSLVMLDPRRVEDVKNERGETVAYLYRDQPAPASL